MEGVIGGVEGRLSCLIFCITLALVLRGPADEDEDRIGANVTEPSSSSPDSGSRSSSLNDIPPLPPRTKDSVLLVVVVAAAAPPSALCSPALLASFGGSSTTPTGCTESFTGDLLDVALVSLILALLVVLLPLELIVDVCARLVNISEPLCPLRDSFERLPSPLMGIKIP